MDATYEKFLAENPDFRDPSSSLAAAASQIFSTQFAADVHAGRVGYRAALDKAATLARQHVQHSADISAMRRQRGYHSQEISKLRPKDNPLCRGGR